MGKCVSLGLPAPIGAYFRSTASQLCNDKSPAQTLSGLVTSARHEKKAPNRHQCGLSSQPLPETVISGPFRPSSVTPKPQSASTMMKRPSKNSLSRRKVTMLSASALPSVHWCAIILARPARTPSARRSVAGPFPCAPSWSIGVTRRLAGRCGRWG
ncbi:MAG: hypothetical protein ACI855_002050 [Myxococcota bacterium]|jgi:hypothetical protein